MQPKKPAINTYTKLLVSLVVVHGMVMTTLSYILSAFGHDPVQNVSVAIITEIIAPVVTFLVTNVVQNIFEHNKLSFSTPIVAEGVKVTKLLDDDTSSVSTDDEEVSQELSHMGE